MRALYNEFVRQTLPDPPPDEGLLVLGKHLYRAVAPAKMWAGLRVFRPGWLLGGVEGKALVPSRALAMGIRPQAARTVHRLELNDPNLPSFLRAGWALVVEEFPLGWARATRKGLRRR